MIKHHNYRITLNILIYHHKSFIMIVMKLVEQTFINPNHPLFKTIDRLCFLSKNVYNVINYRIRQNYFENGKWLSWMDVIKQLANENQTDYRSLPAKISQTIGKLIGQNYQSFFALRKKADNHAGIPRYLNKQGRYVIEFNPQTISKPKHIDDKYMYIVCTKTLHLTIFSKHDNIRTIRFIPKGIGYMQECIYEKPTIEYVNNNHYASIDLGLNNLMTVVNNLGKPSLIINGKPLKSINQFYNKKMSLSQRLLSKNNQYSSKNTKRLGMKRYFKLKHYCHTATAYLVNYLASMSISNLVIGNNKHWKQNIQMGKHGYQHFVFVPYQMLIKQLTYKCQLKGIKTIITEESYTSKSSFIDRDILPVYGDTKVTFAGKRIKRGLYKTKDGRKINADINGAFNILRKAIDNDIYNQSYDCFNVQKVTCVA